MQRDWVSLGTVIPILSVTLSWETTSCGFSDDSFRMTWKEPCQCTIHAVSTTKLVYFHSFAQSVSYCWTLYKHHHGVTVLFGFWVSMSSSGVIIYSLQNIMWKRFHKIKFRSSLIETFATVCEALIRKLGTIALIKGATKKVRRLVSMIVLYVK